MKKKTMKSSESTSIGGEVPTNGAADGATPFVVRVTVEGVADILFHRWNCEAVAEKSKKAKGSSDKKTDNLENYVYRLDEGNPKSNLGIPGEYLRMSIVNAAKFKQDPRSPRKSAMDLFKAAIVPLTTLADLGTNRWDYEDRRRAVIQRSGINRTRPAMKSGWTATFELACNLPEYIDPPLLNEVIGMAGRLVGLGDFRPTYGRFVVTHFESGFVA